MNFKTTPVNCELSGQVAVVTGGGRGTRIFQPNKT
jgi:hypothetical protein